MASYFDEHGCSPLAPGEQPDHMLHLARLLIDGGYGAHFDMEYHRIFPDEPHKPPASKAAIDSLKTAPIEEEGKKCPVCLKDYSPGETVTEIACCHAFHKDCIIPWLTRVSCYGVCSSAHFVASKTLAHTMQLKAPLEINRARKLRSIKLVLKVADLLDTASRNTSAVVSCTLLHSRP
uniref:Putative e3 ubiquitin-protein ligase n=1 Tax=Ixodes ricinus TaxID=34613 RepID=A0A0K8RGX0_IXORI